MRQALIGWTAAMVIGVSTAAAQEPLVQQYLTGGRLSAGQTALAEHLRTSPNDDQARFGLGVLQFLRAVEHLSQSLHSYGAHTSPMMRALPFQRAAGLAGPNAQPWEIRYSDFRAILQDWVDELKAAEGTLAAIKDPAVKLPLKVGLIRMDFDGDGVASDEESFWKLYQQTMNPRALPQAQAAQPFLIGFDAADVLWLRGYCNLLMGVTQFILAHDSQETFNATAHLFFPRPVTPHGWTRERVAYLDFGQGMSIADAIAFLHTIRWEVTDPPRMAAALKHLQEMVRLSRQYWDIVMAETDDDSEWIPNPRQTGVIPNVRITPEMVQAWREFLTESDDLLAGRKLIPFWRSNTLGVNLSKVFTQPRTFDMVLWVQGTAATPYLEEGPLTQPQLWSRWMRVFQGEFIGFALWFN